MAQVLGVDRDTGERISHGKWPVKTQEPGFTLPAGLKVREGVYLTNGKTKVWAAAGNAPTAAVNEFGKGKGVYLSSYTHSVANTRALLELILAAAGESAEQPYVTDNAYTECAFYPASSTLILINNSDSEQTITVRTENGGQVKETLAAFDTKILKV
ncbi:D-galactosyl-beta-1-_4-L-rhamnose phosphorylase [compost metagenome]